MANETPVQEKFDGLKKEFYNRTEAVLVIKRKPKERKLNPDKIPEYRENIIRDYNNFVTFVASLYESQTPESKKALIQSFEQTYNPRLIESLHYIGFHIELPLGKIAVIDEDEITEYSEEASGGKPDDTTKNSNDLGTVIANDYGDNRHQRVPGCETAKAYFSERMYPRNTRNQSSNFDQLYSLETRDIEANRAANRAANRISNANEQRQRRNSGGNVLSDTDFYNLCARTFSGEPFTGDPLALKPYIHKINMVQRRCQTDEHEITLMEHLLSHIKGIAADMLPIDPNSVNEIKQCLMNKIVYDTSGVVKGKLMALRADRNNLSDFSKKVESLGNEFQRALVLEGIPFANANRMVVESTIDLCRANY